MKEFRSAYEKMIRERTLDIGDGMLLQDKNYCESQENIDTLFKEIEEYLSEEQKSLLYRLEEVMNSQMAILQELVCEQGMKDGIELKNILKLVI